MATELVIVGGGGFAREVAWLASESTEGFDLVGYLDDDPAAPADLDGIPRLGTTDRAAELERAQFVIAVGAPRTRHAIAAKLEGFGAGRYARLIHRDAKMSRRVEIAEGSQICAGVILTTNIEIGSHGIVNLSCTIGHDCRFDPFVTLAPLVAVSGNVTLGRGVEVGTASALRQGLTIGAGAMAGMGAVVVKDVEPAALVVGSPAKPLRTLDPFPD